MMKIAISFFCSIFTINAAFIYLLLRTGFSTDYVLVFKTLGLCFILLVLPAFVSLRLPNEHSNRWYANYSFLLFILIIIFCLIGFSFKQLSFDYALILTGLGFPLFIWMAIEFFKTTSLKTVISVLLTSIAFSTFIVSLLFGIHIKPLFYEDLFSGSYPFCVDTLYHIANAQIYNTYQVLTTGLDGVQYIPYHYGAHLLYSELANFLKISIFDAFVILPAMVTAPVFIFAFFHLVLQIRKVNNIPTNFGFAFMVIFLTAFIGFMRNSNYSLGGDIPNYAGMLLGSPILFISDSYTISLFFLIIFSTVILHFYSEYINGSESKTSTIIFLWIVCPMIFFCLAYTKISTLFLALALCGYLFLRLKLYYDKVFIVSFLQIIACSVFVFYLIRDDKFGDGQLSLFYHFREAGQKAHVFMLFNFIWCWVMVVLFFLNRMIRSGKEILVEKKIFGLEVVLVLLVASLVPLFFLEVRGGNIYYFTEISSWFAVVMTLAYLPLLTFEKLKIGSRRYLTARRVLFLLILVYLGNVFYKNTQFYLNWMLKINYAARYYMLKGPVGLITPEKIKIATFIAFDKESFNSILAPFRSVHFDSDRVKPTMSFFNKISGLNELPLSEKKKSAVYLNFSDLKFSLPIKCYEKPFLLPALTGMALIRGGITKQCLEENSWFRGYGYDYYRLNDLSNIDIETLKLETIKGGFEWLYYYDSKTDQFLKIDCKK